MAENTNIPFDFKNPIEFYSGYHKSYLYVSMKGYFTVDIYVPEFFPSQKHYYPLVITDFKSALQSALTIISEKRDIRKLFADRSIFSEITEYMKICLEQWNEEYSMNISGIFPSYISFDNESISVMRISEEMKNRSEINMIPKPVSQQVYMNDIPQGNQIFREVPKQSYEQPLISETYNSVRTTANTWKCTECGCINDSKFCKDCGAKKPIWECECGSVNQSNFCPECGKARPDK